ncbi:MAG: DegV family protein [Chloroflexi bacterium]|nr:DegV family protein [Chloroflexota bacterium]MYK61790.1 DegV family protein [Chloroflexota bacterium]
MSIAVVTDSTADIPSNLVEEYGLTTVPAFVRFGDEEFRDKVDIATEDFYSRLARDKDVFPTTSQPSPGDFKSVYDGLLEEHDEIVSIHISSAVSGTYASAVAGAAQADPSGERIKHVDSRSASMATGFIALTAKQIIDDGGSSNDAVAASNDMVPRVQFGGTPETLEYLKRGGRLKGAQALVAGVLQIRPVLAMVDGEVEVLAKPRSHRRAMSKLISSLAEDHSPLTNLAVMHTDSSSQGEAEDVLEDLKSHVAPGGMTLTATIGPAIGAHLGNGTVGLAVSW